MKAYDKTLKSHGYITLVTSLSAFISLRASSLPVCTTMFKFVVQTLAFITWHICHLVSFSFTTTLHPPCFSHYIHLDSIYLYVNLSSIPSYHHVSSVLGDAPFSTHRKEFFRQVSFSVPISGNYNFIIALPHLTSVSLLVRNFFNSSLTNVLCAKNIFLSSPIVHHFQLNTIH